MENKEAKALITGVRTTPRKARLVADIIRGKNVDEALAILANTNKAIVPVLIKLVNSCAANARNNEKLTGVLYIAEIQVGDGPRLKRFLPRAKGSASALVKRLCRISIVVREK